MRSRATVAVVVCAYTEERWEEVLAAHHSLLMQTIAADEIVIVIDHNPTLLGRLRLQLPTARVIPNRGTRGLSGARNTGIADTSADLVLFLDDDAWAEPDWIAQMVAPFDALDVVGVGGWAEPDWSDPGRPSWFPEPFLWVVGCSYEGLPLVAADIRNPLGCAMAFRRSALDLVEGFSGAVGRVGTHPVGCEETELAIRVRQAEPTSRVMVQPTARVHHKVTANRLGLRYFVDRCFWEGVSKAVVAKAVGSTDALESEKSYASRVLPRSFGRGLGDVLKGRPSGILRSAVIVLGFTCTVLGYVRGKVSGTTSRRSESATIQLEAA